MFAHIFLHCTGTKSRSAALDLQTELHPLLVSILLTVKQRRTTNSASLSTKALWASFTCSLKSVEIYRWPLTVRRINLTARVVLHVNAALRRHCPRKENILHKGMKRLGLRFKSRASERVWTRGREKKKLLLNSFPEKHESRFQANFKLIVYGDKLLPCKHPEGKRTAHIQKLRASLSKEQVLYRGCCSPL